MSAPSRHALGEVSSRPRQKRVIVTGSSGKLGRATTAYLASAGWEVIAVDKSRPPGISEDGKTGLGGAYRLVEVDLQDMGSVLETFIEVDMAYSGIDAVVHLAAIPSPGQTASARQWSVNSVSTYNVLEACRKLHIKNLVLASSETLIGIPIDENPPAHLPITEDLELKPQSAYSLSKLVGETLADQYAKWDPETKIISLRFSNVMLEHEYANFPGWQNDFRARCWNAWGYVDARDGGQAVSRALDSTLKGHHAYLVAAGDTCMSSSNKELIEAVFPNVKYNPTADPRGSLLSIEKARRDLGYEPKYSWQSLV